MRSLFLAACLLLTALGVRAEVVDIDTAELARLLAAKVPLIDVRTASEWQESGVVPDSHLLTFFDERGGANPQAWLEKARSVSSPAEPVILICRSGNRSQAVSRFLSQQAGYAKVYNVKAGIRAWISEKRPLEPGAQARAACQAARTC